MRKRFHGLKKPKPRQDWSKWNLYNISRMRTPMARNMTFFQQKWMAKSLTRAYHGEQIREGQWTRMFDRRLPAVVPMNYQQLARTDGSDQAMGRGSGLQAKRKPSADGSSEGPLIRKATSYMHMTYHPTERRLDTAVWRALFASSTRQARQFVVHGFVKVNGKKMQYPGYLLNPGDMFSVEPERVLFATGARKHSKNSPDTLQGQRVPDEIEQIVDDDAEDLLDEQEVVEPEEEADEAVASPEDAQKSAQDNPKQTLKSLLARAKSITKDNREGLSGRRKQDLRVFARDIKKTMSRLRPNTEGSTNTGELTVESLEETLNAIAAKLPDPSVASKDTATVTTQQSQPEKEDAYRVRKDAKILYAALVRANENPVDASKPYATPWKPREYMSAFAFIPRYLEVNQKICSAVYLRHPVARPGLAEVPTPFSGETMALAFNWYLRRR